MPPAPQPNHPIPGGYIQTLTITGHSTRSNPSTHVVFAVEVGREPGQKHTVYRRYSDFVQIHSLLSLVPIHPSARVQSLPELPPKQSAISKPYGFLDDVWLAERKAKLQTFLDSALAAHKHNALLRGFVSPLEPESGPKFPSEQYVKNHAKQLAEDAVAGQGVMEVYFTDWGDISPDNLPYSKLTHVAFSFVTPGGDGSLGWDGDGSQDLLRNLVSKAHAQGVKVIVAIGGWGGSAQYSNAVRSGSRANFVNNVKGLVNNFGVDGFDFDWEYPNNPGAGNVYSAQDADNYLATLRDVRNAIGPDKWISIAVPTGGLWDGTSNVSGFAQLDVRCMIMNYDVNGASSNPGPNAPYDDLCHDSSQPTANAVGGIRVWNQGGFPLAQIVLGMPMYGYVSRSNRTSLTHIALPPGVQQTALRVQDADQDADPGKKTEAGSPLRGHHPSQPVADKQPASGAPDNTPTDPGTSEEATFGIEAGEVKLAGTGDMSDLAGQQVNFLTAIQRGALQFNSSTGLYDGVNSNQKYWDDCSDTPFLVSQQHTTVYTYDDPDSITSKAQYAYQQGCAGVAFWEISGDDRNNNYPLLRAARSAFGYSS